MYGPRIRLVRPPHRAARQDRARRPRPRRRLRYPPAWPADERLADRNLRSRLAVLAGTVRRVGGPAHEPRSAGRYRPRAWHVLAAGVEPDGPVDADGDQALVIYEARHPTVLPGGEAARPWDAATAFRGRRRPPRSTSCQSSRRRRSPPSEPGGRSHTIGRYQDAASSSLASPVLRISGRPMHPRPRSKVPDCRRGEARRHPRGRHEVGGRDAGHAVSAWCDRAQPR